MTAFLGEFFGTAFLLLLGNGVVANVVLRGTKGENSGWIVITMGWAMAVTMAVFLSNAASGAHLNPAVTLALAATGKFDWANVGSYITAQMLGAMLGAALVWLHHMPHFARTEDAGAKLAVFSTGPAIRHTASNFFSEFIGTFAFMIGICALGATKFADGVGPLMVGLLVLSVGLSMGGPTGYAINPARDLGPRVMHALLPIPGKGSSDWQYAWIPVLGPILGAIAGATAYNMAFGG